MMLDFFSQSILLFVVLLVLTYARLSRAISYSGGVPRVGKSGVLGYIQTALKWTVDAESIILEGRKQFSNRPFSGAVFFLGPEYMKRVRAGPDSIFNEMMAVNEDLQLPYTMDEHQLSNPYQARVLRTDVNRNLQKFVPALLDESILSMNQVFKPLKNGDAVSIPVFDTMTHLVARISNRVIFGKELCRNDKFLKAIVRFAETTPLIAPFVQWSPFALRPVVYFIISSILGGKKAPLRIMIPYLERYIKTRESLVEKPALISEYLIQNAPPEERIEGLAVRLLNVNFGSIHTSSIFLTQTLFEIALLSKEDVESIRTEVKETLEVEGGWSKAAINKFYKIDSALREVGRYYGLMHFALPRFAVVGCDLGDGTHVPPGYRVAIDMKAIHFNPLVYPDANRCDLFRFSKLRTNIGSEAQCGFTTVDDNYLPFGAGRHACAGRSFASMELKLMLAHILLEYEVSYPAGVRERPNNVVFNGAIVPDTKAHLVFRPITL